MLSQGASLRRHRFWFDLRIMAVPVALAAFVQAAIYAIVLARAGWQDWSNYAVTVAVLALVPFISGILLSSMRQQEFPITSAAIVTGIVHVFAVAALSAFRIPLSYFGLLLIAPGTMLIMVGANVRFRRASFERVAILSFPGAEELRKKLGRNTRIIASPDDDIHNIDRVLIDTVHHALEWSRFLTRLHMVGIEVTPWLKYLETRLRRVDVAHFDIGHISFSLSQIYYVKAKRAVDVIAVIVSAPLALCFGVLIGAYIYVLDGGPIIFQQQRRAYGGGSFTIFKFRTMYKGSGDQAVQARDSRILPGCRLLRQLRLDELPQLYNIIRGEMSWIGPRPVSVAIAEICELMTPQYSHRHLVLPGLTGWAQVSHGYASTPDEEIQKLAYDLFYIKEISFDLDLLILIKTVGILLTRNGAR
jgi:lipopolysaccharide/colanic/teichoic acid biosynthesis glycosyltransferase